MKVDQKGTQLQSKILKEISLLLMKVTHQYKTFEKQNIIIDLLYHKDLTIDDVKLLLQLSEQHKKAKIFIIVISDLDYNAVPDTLTVVPSILEAHDIMEEIERDLGFKK
jgi:hydroxymethylpyrimidine pyrophosphatase-like HAD family hydrolase